MKQFHGPEPRKGLRRWFSRLAGLLTEEILRAIVSTAIGALLAYLMASR